jgi:hypothetical protein
VHAGAAALALALAMAPPSLAFGRLAGPYDTPPAAPQARASGHGVRYAARVVSGVPVRVVTVDLRDPDVVVTLRFANDAPVPNAPGDTRGAEPFPSLVRKLRAAAVVNGTFFSKNAECRVMGNMVRNGQLVKFSPWERGGTTFVLDAGNAPRLRTDEDEGDAPWESAWLALTAGPRLLRDGTSWCRPEDEGFRDPHVLGAAGRSALGFDALGATLTVVSFEAGVTLQREAAVMRALGCHQAMNLDGGASRALAVGGRVIVPAGRPLTNVLAFYDRRHPAPSAMRAAFAGHGGE